MLPALTTKPKQAVRQVKGLTNDSIDSYSNTPLGGSSGGMAATYVDNTESGNGTPRSPPASSRAIINTGRVKSATEEGLVMARVVRDRKASGEEELSLRTGDIVKVLSSKRTGYLKCEAGDEVGYVPSSYLEFLDSNVEENGNSNAVGDESQRAGEKQRKKKKEKRKKEKREVNDTSETEEAAPPTARSPRKEVANTEEDGNESPRKRKKKDRKHRDAGEDTARGAVVEGSPSARSRATSEDTERTRSKSKHSKKKRHRDVDSSASSESDAGKRSARHSRRRHHRRGSSASDSNSTSSDDSDGSYRRRRRRRRHRHRRSSSEDEDEDDSDYKRRSRRSRKRRDRANGDSEPDESSRKAEKKMSATVQEVEKGVSKLDVKAEEKAEAKPTAPSSRKEEPSRDRGKKEETERSEGSSEGRATNVSSSRKDDEGRTSTSTSSSNKQNSSKSGLGRQIGEKMRSFLAGGSKKQHSSKGSSGILNACSGTVQGEEGWYEHGENERYYFVLVDGKWSLLYGPMTEDDFEVYSNRVLEQNRTIELPPTYLHKTGYYLNRELRVQKEQ